MKPSIDWIDVNTRVPDNRRPVLVWGQPYLRGLLTAERATFLGTTRYNVKSDGSGAFDNERTPLPAKVTFWAEIQGPYHGTIFENSK